MTIENDLMTSRIILKAMLPVMKVIAEDDPAMRKRLDGTRGIVQFKARNNTEEIGAAVVFENGSMKIHHGIHPSPQVCFSFGSIRKLNAFFTGKIVLPKIQGLSHPGLIIKILSLLLKMKLMMPDVRPSSPELQKMKVKMVFYMITTALSQYNKGGNPEMTRWTGKQPERIYQITVEGDNIAAYLRIKAGKSKAGRGTYARRRPFVHLRFNGVSGAIPVILNDVDMVDAMKQGFLTVEGSPEYGRDFGDFMQRIQALVT